VGQSDRYASGHFIDWPEERENDPDSMYLAGEFVRPAGASPAALDGSRRTQAREASDQHRPGRHLRYGDHRHFGDDDSAVPGQLPGDALGHRERPIVRGKSRNARQKKAAGQTERLVPGKSVELSAGWAFALSAKKLNVNGWPLKNTKTLEWISLPPRKSTSPTAICTL
jgi:hypothetical protein